MVVLLSMLFVKADNLSDEYMYYKRLIHYKAIVNILNERNGSNSTKKEIFSLVGVTIHIFRKFFYFLF